MVVNFMQNLSPEIQVVKTLSTSKPLNCALKADCDILNPVLIIQGEKITSYNYFSIPDFGGRYYFIDSIITRNENTLEIVGRIDVLMSFQTDILNATGIIERNEKEYIKYITDSKYTVLNYERIQTKQFPSSFPSNGEFILVVAGS